MLRELKVYEATIRYNIVLKIGRNVQDEVSSESYEIMFLVYSIVLPNPPDEMRESTFQ